MEIELLFFIFDRPAFIEANLFSCHRAAHGCGRKTFSDATISSTAPAVSNLSFVKSQPNRSLRHRIVWRDRTRFESKNTF